MNDQSTSDSNEKKQNTVKIEQAATGQVAAGDAVCIGYISGIRRQLDKIYQAATVLIGQVRASSDLYLKEEDLITYELNESVKQRTLLNPKVYDPGFYRLLADKKALMQKARQIVYSLREEEKTDEQKENELASLLLNQKDLFLFFNPPRFGDHSLKEATVASQNDLRDALLDHARIVAAVENLNNLRSSMNQLDCEMTQYIIDDILDDPAISQLFD